MSHFFFKDYYLILGIKETSTSAEIKSAYKKMSLKYHPDKNGGDKYFEERFKDINEAYQVLIDVEKRIKYDYERLEALRNSEVFLSVKKSQREKSKKVVRKKKQKYYIYFLIIIFALVIISILLPRKENTVHFTPPKALTTNQNPTNLPKLNVEELKRGLSDKEILELEKKRNNVQVQAQNSIDSNFKNIEILDEKDLKIVKLVWGNYDYAGKEKKLNYISILNKSSKTIGEIYISFKVFNSNGVETNSGKFTLNKKYSTPRTSVSQKPNFYYLTKVEPNSAKELSVESLFTPIVRTTDKITLKVDGYSALE